MKFVDDDDDDDLNRHKQLVLVHLKTMAFKHHCAVKIGVFSN